MADTQITTTKTFTIRDGSSVVILNGHAGIDMTAGAVVKETYRFTVPSVLTSADLKAGDGFYFDGSTDGTNDGYYTVSSMEISSTTTIITTVEEPAADEGTATGTLHPCVEVVTTLEEELDDFTNIDSVMTNEGA